ncbi:cell division control protein 31-like [Polistes fuscatus]|uniref:cell division control protein 31-like n=1 Tax=Polistes fuscatus TaxID=30207 RepID=UPI001CA8C8A5|nr:cell division control protein 31-like [Polistes fuscatus]
MEFIIKKTTCKDDVDSWKNKKCLIKEAFKSMDTDSDGYLNYYEAKTAMKALGLRINKSFVLSTIRMYDKRGDSKISFDDFYFVVFEKLNKQNPVDHLKYVFKIFTAESFIDKIRLEDLQRINNKIGSNLTIDEMQLMIKEFDRNQDDSIDEAEFIEMMTES